MDILNIPNQQSEPEKKFNTCKFRSETQVTKVIKYCCGSKTRKGYECNKRGIFPLMPLPCGACTMYESKS